MIIQPYIHKPEVIPDNVLLPQQLHGYQKECVLHGLYNDCAMFWLQMGLGKTIIALTILLDRMRAGQVKRVLIFGPLRVVTSVWSTEALKWAHTRRLSFSVLTGTRQQRARALFRNADITLVNYENMNWLTSELLHYYVNQGLPLPFDMVIYDEISKMKNSSSLRFTGEKRIIETLTGKEHKWSKKLSEELTAEGIPHEEYDIHGWKKVMNKFKYRLGLTGSPAPNGYLDLFGQFYTLDGGKRLGEYITHYKNNYFMSDYMGYKYTPTETGKRAIEIAVSDITKKMDAKDYLNMPKVTETEMYIDLPAKHRKQYKELEREMFLELESGSEIEVFNKASLSNKCLQFCNGAVYTELTPKPGKKIREYEVIHDIKLKALEEIMEEAAGSPVLCGYNFKSDADRIMKVFKKKYAPVNLTDSPVSATGSIIRKWNNGDIRLLIGHPASIGHGIDGLQTSGSIIAWFGATWNLELYEQLNGRINRQGQTRPVSIIRILCRNTTDMIVKDALENKDTDQEGLKKSVDRYKKSIGLINSPTIPAPPKYSFINSPTIPAPPKYSFI